MAPCPPIISSQEPIDVVMHESCEGHETLWDSYKQVKFVPFNPTDKYTIASVVPNDGSPPYRLMKGAPQVWFASLAPSVRCAVSISAHRCGTLQVVLRNAANKEAIRTEVEEKIVEFANRGYRALGLSRAQGLEGTPQGCQKRPPR